MKWNRLRRRTTLETNHSRASALPAAPDYDESELVQHMADGQEWAIAHLYDIHSPRLYGMVLALVDEEADAEEVILDTFMQAWRSAGRFNQVRGSVRTWLATIARSRALDCLRRRARRLRAHERAFADASLVLADHDEAPTSDSGIAHQELQARITRALSQLSPEQRQVIELSFLGGSTQARVAEHLGLPLGTVKTRTRLALRSMRKVLVASG